MEVVLAILLIAAIAGALALWGYLKKQAARALNRSLFERGNHRRGQAATTEAIEFSVPVPAATVIAAVRDRLGLTTTPPTAFLAALHLIEERPGLLLFGYGNKLQLTFRSALSVDDKPGGSSSGTYTVLEWVEGDGIVRGIPEMERLSTTIRAVAAELGHGATPVSAPATAVTRRFCENCGSGDLGEKFCTACGEPLPV